MPGLGLGSRLPVGTECRLVEPEEAARLRPIGCQRDILRREEAGNEAIVQRSKTATRRSRNKAE